MTAQGSKHQGDYSVAPRRINEQSRAKQEARKPNLKLFPMEELSLVVILTSARHQCDSIINSKEAVKIIFGGLSEVVF